MKVTRITTKTIGRGLATLYGSLLLFVVLSGGIVPSSWAAMRSGRTWTEVASPNREEIQIVENEGRISARIHKAELHLVLGALRDVTGLNIVWVGRKGDDELSATFRGLSMESAVRRLLRDRDYVITYPGGNDGPSVTTLIILGDAQPSVSGRDVASRHSFAAAASRIRRPALPANHREPDPDELVPNEKNGPEESADGSVELLVQRMAALAASFADNAENDIREPCETEAVLEGPTATADDMPCLFR